ncbi:MAG: hypothetical protein Tsb009_34860 [Planctomycetaceae bacterium]
MERAIEELKKANREGASKKQDEAIKELEIAQAKLEEILRQLREEERELMLRDLQSRFKNMLRMQKIVFNGTVSLNTTPHSRWKAQQVARSRELAGDEGKIVIEADKAQTLLKEEGSSIAFPEAVEELREDMVTVARMLAKEDTGKENQEIQRDIMDALSEIIDALKKELEKKDKEKKDPPPKPPSDQDPPDPSLVDKLAELKMLRSLQMRVNRRTRRLGLKIKGEQATEKDAEVVEQLKQLAKRQARIQKAAYDLATNKNQ